MKTQGEGLKTDMGDRKRINLNMQNNFQTVKNLGTAKEALTGNILWILYAFKNSS